MLRDLGFVISQATSTAEAERYLAAGRFDLVITDLTRDRDGGPEAGLQLIRVVKGRDPDMPVIVYAFEPGDRAERALRDGAAAVVTTPAELLSGALAQVTGR
jgi:DNA-binding NtrC family response regulator